MAIFLHLPFFALSQTKPGLQLIPLGYVTTKSNPAEARQQAVGDTLVLPFWDDFSAPFNASQSDPTFQPDTNLWAPGSQNVRINDGMAINPPTIGVATFDGVDASGRAYNDNGSNSGLSDSLISKPINLALVPANERNRVFFSFFWQQKGNGEMPDAEDSLRLQFKNNQNQWITQWVKTGGDSAAIDQFVQEIFPVTDPSFYHPGFQFRFQSYNRQSGGFDTWNIDYVYLNKNRSASNTAYLDRALTSLPSSLFKEYTAVPMEILRENPEAFIGTSSVGFYNLNVQIQPVRFTAQVKNKITGAPIAILNDQNALSPVPAGFDRRIITADPLNVSSLDLNADSLYLETEFYLTSGDKYLIESINGADTVFNTTVDYRVNDTVATTFVIDDYFAYDDGEAEFGVELNQKNGKLAYQFYTPKRVLLTHIDMYLPAITQNANPLSIRVLIWKSLGNDTIQDVELRGFAPIVRPANQLNDTVSFTLESPVFVQDTFYIGYEQQSDNLAVIGFDKNTNSGDKIFFNVGGGWEQNPDLKGSLMLRPRFDKNVILTDIPDLPQRIPFKVYPNPTDDLVTVEGLHDEIVVLNVMGQQVYGKSYTFSLPSSTHDLSNLQSGIYLLKIRHKKQYYTTKLILR